MILGLWFAIRVHACKEFVAEQILREAGLEVYLPCELRWKRINHIDRRRREIPYPLIPRYLFVGCLEGVNLPWERVFAFGLVSSVIGSNGVPRAISEPAMAIVREQATPARRVAEVRAALRNERIGMAKVPRAYWDQSRNRPATAFKVGDEAMLGSASPFAGQTVRVQKIRGRKAKILLSLFGSEQEAEVPIELLEAS